MKQLNVRKNPEHAALINFSTDVFQREPKMLRPILLLTSTCGARLLGFGHVAASPGLNVGIRRYLTDMSNSNAA